MRTYLVLGFGLVLGSGSALADPAGNLVNGVTGVLSGTVSAAAPSAGSASLVGLPPLAGAGNGAGVPLNTSSAAALPGLDGAPVDISVLQLGADGSGYGNVLMVNQVPVIGPQVNGIINHPMVGGPSSGMAAIAILDGNSTAHAAPDGVLSAAVISGNDTATGGAVGAAVLSGSHSGTGSVASIGAVNQGDLAHVCIGATCVTSGQAPDASGVLPYTTVAPGVVVGGGPTRKVDSSNPVLNVGVLTGTQAGTGGLVGVGVIAGAKSGQGSVAGVCVLCGNNSGQGNLGVAVLSGNNSGSGVAGTLPVGAGAAVLSGNNSGNGSSLGGAVLSGTGSGIGGMAGGAVLSGTGGGAGGLISTGVLSQNPPAPASTGGGNGGQALPGIIPGVAPGGTAGGTGFGRPGDISQVAGDDSLVPADDSVTADDSAVEEDAVDSRRGSCLIVVKNVKDRTTQSMKRSCKG